MTDLMNDYTAFVASHNGEYPRATVPAERDLALWMQNTGALQDSGQLDPATVARLETIDGWAAHDYDRRWLTRVREYELWLKEHDGRRPRMNGAGTTPYERVLGRWATHQRRTIRAEDSGCRKPDARARILHDRIPTLLQNGWADWARRLSEYTAWATRTGTAPEGGSEDQTERQLGRWLLRQIDELSLDRLSADRVSALDRAISGWADNVDLSWETRLHRYRRFVESNGGCAPRDGTGNKFEQFLFGWELAQRAAIGDGVLDADRVALFHSVNPNREHTAACTHLNKPRRR